MITPVTFIWQPPSLPQRDSFVSIVLFSVFKLLSKTLQRKLSPSNLFKHRKSSPIKYHQLQTQAIGKFLLKTQTKRVQLGSFEKFCKFYAVKLLFRYLYLAKFSLDRV